MFFILCKSTILYFIITYCVSFSLNAGDWFFMPAFDKEIKDFEKISSQDLQSGFTPNMAKELLSEKTCLSKEEKNSVKWHDVKFPHKDFVKIMPKNKTFGWYAHSFDIPELFVGFDILLDLGLIDDIDETYVNRKKIGALGKFPGGSLWQLDRLYRVPQDILLNQNNTIFVHVWNRWGLGGMTMRPNVKAAIAPEKACWEIAPVPKLFNIQNMNNASSAEQALDYCFIKTQPNWRKVPLEVRDWPKWKWDNQYIVYKFDFKLLDDKNEPLAFNKPVVLDLGAVFDVASIFLNNVKIGQIGRFPENGIQAFSEASSKVQVLVDPQNWSEDGNNHLLVVTYKDYGVGGLPGQPGFLFDSENYIQKVNLDFYQQCCLIGILINSQKFDEAEEAINSLAPENDSEQVWKLSLMAHLSSLKWLASKKTDVHYIENILIPIKEIFDFFPAESPRQSAMQGFCQLLRDSENNPELYSIILKHFPFFNKGILYLGADRTTKGNWPLYYGRRFYVLAAMGQVKDWQSGTTRNRLKYNTSIPGNIDEPRLWLDSKLKNVNSPSALIMHGIYQKIILKYGGLPMDDIHNPIFPNENIRRASWWDDHGEMHPFDDEGPNFDLSLELEQGCHMVSLYLVDHDWRRTTHPRQQSILIFDEQNHLLNAVWSGKSDEGVYERFAFEDHSKIVFRVNKHRSPCVAIGGVFVDTLPCINSIIYEENSDKDQILYLKSFNHINGLEQIKKAREWSLLTPRYPNATNKSTGLAIDIACLEKGFQIQSNGKDIISAIQNINNFENFLALLQEIGKIQDIHSIWYCLLYNKLKELSKENTLKNNNDNKIIIYREFSKDTRHPWNELIRNSIFN